MENRLLPFTENPFETLCIPKGVVSELRPDQLGQLIKRMYIALQTVYHPDKGGDTMRAAEIVAAYQYLTKDHDTFVNARELYLREGEMKGRRWLGEIQELEKKLENLTSEKEKTDGKNERKIATLKGKLNLESTAVREILRIIPPPEGAVDSDHYKDFVYVVTYSKTARDIDIKKHDYFVQILDEGFYHVLKGKRSKVLPTGFKIFGGILEEIIPSKLKKQTLHKESLRMTPAMLNKIAFSVRPYLVKGGVMVFREVEKDYYMGIKINDIIPKEKFEHRRFVVIQE